MDDDTEIVDNSNTEVSNKHNNLHITGVGNEQQPNEQYNGDYEQYNEQYDDDVSIENGLPDDPYITINDMNTIHEMNAGQLNVNPDTGEVEEDMETGMAHTYNLRPRPTKRSQKYNMTVVGQQSTIANHTYI